MKKLFVMMVVGLMSSAIWAAGTEVTFDLQITRGDSVITKAGATTLDGEAVPIAVLKEESYLKSVAVADGVETLTPGTVTTGFMATLTPQVQKDGAIKTHIVVSITDLKEPLNIDQNVILEHGAPLSIKAGDYTVKLTAKKV